MKTSILNLSSILLGFVYVMFILWNRLIRERLPRDLCGIYDTYVWIIFCALFLYSLILFLYYCKQILQIKSQYIFLSKLLDIKVIKHIVDFILIYIIKAPYNSYIWIYNNINLLPIIEKIGLYVWDRDPYKDPIKIYIFCCILRFTIIVSFCIDILIFNKFHYFYKSLILLLIYLMCNCIIFILNDISKDNKNFITNNYISVKSDIQTNVFDVNFLPTYDGDRSDQMLLNHYNVWFCYLANCMFVDKYYEYTEKYNKYVNVIYYGIYAMGWGYIIYKSC